MKTTLNLPADLVAEACAVLGVTTPSEVVELALRDLVRKSRAGELKAVLRGVFFEFDRTAQRRPKA
ncbi:MAG: type II toxin-antitoxin system VapB family antitoxin [Vicinamibacteraceae bacterium]